ncbi:hypothetical protein [Cyanobium sp. Candia 9D4]|uniref:hypothetical protein n=1 Tax=Cyanobium sp. Candia 9D4 TaxID=2823707 RepID=UPI0020CDEB6B|nr:hypothetical protein [Cyanobium sp. Candia 9D4]
MDWTELSRFLTALGRSAHDSPLVFALYPRDVNLPCIHYACTAGSIPKRRIEDMLRKKPDLSLGLVINPPSVRPDDWGCDPSHFSGKSEQEKKRRCWEWNRGRTRYEHACPPKAWGSKSELIDHASSIWLECDGGLSLKEQEVLACKVGLPEPSLTVWSGGKSLHTYCCLSESISKEKYRELMERLCLTINATAPEAGADGSLKNANRVMRVPGSLHASTKERCRINKHTGTQYTLEELEKHLLPLLGNTDTNDIEYAGTQTPNNNWFNDLAPPAQEKMAVEMLQYIPKRKKPSAQGGPLGTRAPAIKVLHGLVGHFGQTKAAEICAKAGWRNEYWSPEAEMQSISDPYCGIGVVIKAARESGWEGGGRYPSLDEQLEQYFGRSARKR